jgi:REP element-mobilizing transposase RayT
VGAAFSRDANKPNFRKSGMKPSKGSKLLRKGRASITNQFYLLTTVTYKRKPIFTRSEAVEIVLSSLLWLEKHGKIVLEAAVVMPDHLHFVAELQMGILAELMHSLKSYTARKINFLLKRRGRFWQAQYYDHVIRKDEVLHDVIVYCLKNPVRAGLVTDFHEYPYWYCRWAV